MRISDWSSDVCSSDLAREPMATIRRRRASSRASASGSDNIKEVGDNADQSRADATSPTQRNLRRNPARDHRAGGDRLHLLRLLQHCGRCTAYAARLCGDRKPSRPFDRGRSEEPTSELQSLMRISYAVFCLKKKNLYKRETNTHIIDPLVLP